MPNAQWCNKWGFETRLTNLATNTTLGTATRHDFAAKSIKFPHSSGTPVARTIVAADLCATFRDASTAATDLDGVRLGIKYTGGSFSDVDLTYALANGGDHFFCESHVDVTSYLETNDPGTLSPSIEVGIAVATGAASNVNNITACVDITYDYDETATSVIRTACWPVQSHHTRITTTFLEPGTTGGAANAPVNQIPKMTGSGGEFESVTGFTVLQWFIDVLAQDNGQTTSDVTPSYRFDGGTTRTRAVLEMALASPGTRYHDRYFLDASGENLSTAAAHSFEALADVDVRMQGIGGLVWLTYEMTESSSQQYTSVIVPLESQRTGLSGLGGFDTTEKWRMTATVDVQEPGSISMRQSGIVLGDGHGGNNVNLVVNAPSQTERSYNKANLANSASGFQPTIHRTDHSSSNWTLGRGVNALHVDFKIGAVSNADNGITGYAIVNYRCGRFAGTGFSHRHARTVTYPLMAHQSAAAKIAIVGDTVTPALPESSYALMGVTMVAHPWEASDVGSTGGAQRAAGEDSGSGFWAAQATDGFPDEVGTSHFYFPATSWFRPHGLASEPGGNIETARNWLSMRGINVNAQASATLWVTYHGIIYPVHGTVRVDGAEAGAGEPVKIWAIGDTINGVVQRGHLIAEGVTDANGEFDFAAYDDTLLAFAECSVDASANGRSPSLTPSDANDFSVTINKATPGDLLGAFRARNLRGGS